MVIKNYKKKSHKIFCSEQLIMCIFASSFPQFLFNTKISLKNFQLKNFQICGVNVHVMMFVVLESGMVMVDFRVGLNGVLQT